jgi:dipeptidyl aminopeptidase/acylaminoacyl peptidase
VVLLFLSTAAAQVPVPTESRYIVPPKVIVDILDAPQAPQAVVSPTRDRVALLHRRNMPGIAELAQPMFRLGGTRVNPLTNGPHRAPDTIAIRLQSIEGGPEVAVDAPSQAPIGAVTFSPDGKALAFTVTRANGVELWVADAATGRARAVTGATLNALHQEPCAWAADSASLLCRFVAATRGAAPVAPAVPTGPTVQQTQGKAAPAPTYQDLLETDHDERLFEYYFSAQLARVEVASGRQSPLGTPGLFEKVDVSPDGRFVLVSRLKRPFSRLVPASGFAKDVEVWNAGGQLVKTIADLPTTEGVPINGVPIGPRAWDWTPTDPATVVWVEALDEGDLRNRVPHRDRLLELRAPFSAAPSELMRTEYRYSDLSWTEKGTALVSEFDRTRRWTRTWLLDSQTGGEPRKLWDRSQEDAYGNPGAPLTKTIGAATVIAQNGNAIYLAGPGSSPEGDRPFLDRLDLQTLATERVLRSDPGEYEVVVALLTSDAGRVLTRFETPLEPPNYRVRHIATGARQAITTFKDPTPALAGIQKQLVTYTRKDGVQLSGTLYLPPGYQKGERLPMVMWAYPREFTDRNAAGQVRGSTQRFTTMSGASHLLLLTQGYAIFDNPTMPIVGPGETANDTYVDQLVASAQAAVDKVVEMGVADRGRIGVGGHSYGAFMTANLLAHSNVFRAGIARSGAYNRSLTPFGFQNERRTFWEVPAIYARMSPFWHANGINEPILLIHGEADNNSGTYPIQSERLYMALKGHGATVRYVTLPHESHGYAARESVLHTVAEMLNWMDTHVKSAPRLTTESAAR